jgi:hypothetical protein
MANPTINKLTTLKTLITVLNDRISAAAPDINEALQAIEQGNENGADAGRS